MNNPGSIGNSIKNNKKMGPPYCAPIFFSSLDRENYAEKNRGTVRRTHFLALWMRVDQLTKILIKIRIRMMTAGTRNLILNTQRGLSLNPVLPIEISLRAFFSFHT